MSDAGVLHVRRLVFSNIIGIYLKAKLTKAFLRLSGNVDASQHFLEARP